MRIFQIIFMSGFLSASSRSSLPFSESLGTAVVSTHGVRWLMIQMTA